MSNTVKEKHRKSTSVTWLSTKILVFFKNILLTKERIPLINATVKTGILATPPVFPMFDRQGAFGVEFFLQPAVPAYAN